MSRSWIKHRAIIDTYKADADSSTKSLPEQLIIRVWKACNFRCNFCNVAANEAILWVKPQIKEILAQTFYRIKYSNFSSWVVNVTISWWEPSIFQIETIFVLKYFEKYFNCRNINATFELQSNASNISKKFSEDLKKNKIFDVMVSNHTHDPDEYKTYIWVPYDVMWPKVHRGIRNLISSWITVSFNTILSWINAGSYLDHIKYLHKNYPEVLVYNIGFIQPHWMAQENFDKLFIQYHEVSKIYNDVVCYLKASRKKVHSHLVWLPLCYLDDWSCCMEYYHNKSIILQWPSWQTLIQSINDDNKWYDTKCNSCMVKWLCSGIWKEYIWKQKIKPIKYSQYFSNDISSKTSFYTWREKIWKIKSRWVQQVFILDSLNHIEWIADLRKFWFQMITLCFNKIPNKVDLILYASLNIQILDFHYSMKSFLDEVVYFNSKTWVQFHIRLDIHVYNFDGSIEKLIHLDTYQNFRFHLINPKISSQKRDNIYIYYK